MSIQPGTYVIVRARDAGVHAGEYVSHTGREVVLKNSRRLWRWWSSFTLSALAEKGVLQSKVRECRFACVVANLTILDACELIVCTDTARASIEAVPEWINE
jgi:hypothetical protein